MNKLAPAVLSLALACAAIGVAATFGTEALAPFSGFAAGVFKAVVCAALFVLLDRWVLPGDVCEEIVTKRNAAYGLMLVALALLLSATVATAAPSGATVDRRGLRSEAGAGSRGAVFGRAAQHGASTGALDARAFGVPVWRVQHSADGPRPRWVTAALGEVGTRETGGANRGAEVAGYLRSVGIARPAPWCAGFVRWSLDQAVADVRDARGASIRSAVATAWLGGAGTIRARDVERRLARPPRGSVVVWRNGNGWTGHAAVLDWWDRRCGETVEGNTSSGRSGSQRDGDGVWARTRCVSPGAYFRIVGFVPVVAGAGAGAPAGAAPRILAPAVRRRGLFAPLRWRLRPGTWAT